MTLIEQRNPAACKSHPRKKKRKRKKRGKITFTEGSPRGREVTTEGQREITINTATFQQVSYKTCR